mmetsp:Transcript_11862/g.24173  ORF Transcript_11862/g.24173 Transcript_11862/m.24173 type:complete len:96 (+) Transcript_11862:1984-2271(+)
MSARILPGSLPKTMILSARVTASSIPWVTMRIALVESSPSCQRRRSSDLKFSAVSTSSAEKGSSMHKSSGLTANALANPTRCRIPPESSLGKAFS